MSMRAYPKSSVRRALRYLRGTDPRPRWDIAALAPVGAPLVESVSRRLVSGDRGTHALARKAGAA